MRRAASVVCKAAVEPDRVVGTLTLAHEDRSRRRTALEGEMARARFDTHMTERAEACRADNAEGGRIGAPASCRGLMRRGAPRARTDQIALQSDRIRLEGVQSSFAALCWIFGQAASALASVPALSFLKAS